MSKRPSHPHLVLATVVLWLVAPSSALWAAPGLQGTVVDVAGLPLAQVQIFLGRPQQDLRISSTDANGVYRFSDLAPASYTLLAMKSGYAASFSRVDTLVHRSMDLTLRVLGEPAAEPVDPASLPQDRSWMLRHPRRDLLRELERPDALTLPAEAGEAPSAAQPLVAEVRQWVSVAGDVGGPEDSYQTEIDFSRGQGEKILWTVGGTLQRTDTEFARQELSRREQDAGQLRMSVQLRPNAGNQVDLTAFLGREDLQFALADPAGLEDGSRSGRIWGYDAAWSKQLANGSDLDLQVGYGSAQAQGNVLGVSETELSENRWHALGSFRFSPLVRHEVQVGIRADGYQFDSSTQRLTYAAELAPASLIGTGQDGWTLNLFGRDTFSLSEPLDLELGMDYRRLGFEESLSYFTPHAGVSYRPAPGQTIRAVVMVQFADSSASARQAPGLEDPHGSPRMGYMLVWEHKTRQDLSYALAASVRPFTGEGSLEGSAFYLPEPGGALFGTDGNASTRELSFRLEKRYRGLQGSTGVRIGQVEGNLISYMPGDIPTQRLGNNEARFVSTMLQTSIVTWGTHIQIGFHWVENDSLQLGALGAMPVTYSSLDMQIQQDLSMLPGRAEWRVLLGYRGVQNRADKSGELGLARLGVPEESHRVSGGVAVSF